MVSIKFPASFQRHKSTIIRHSLIEGEHMTVIFFAIEKAYDTTWKYGINVPTNRLSPAVIAARKLPPESAGLNLDQVAEQLIADVPSWMIQIPRLIFDLCQLKKIRNR